MAQVHGNSSAQEARRSQHDAGGRERVVEGGHGLPTRRRGGRARRRRGGRRRGGSRHCSRTCPPATHPAAGAHTGLTDEELAGLDATSVELLPDAEREAALAAPAAKSAAAPKSSSGPGPALAGPSGPPSTAGSVPATAETLQAELREL